MKKLLLCVALLASALQADPGFYLPESTAVPRAVSQAAARVFSLWVFSDQARFEIGADQVPPLLAQMKKGDYSALEGVGISDPVALRLILEDLQALPKGTAYRINSQIRGSAFVVGGKLITALHAFTANGRTPREFFAAPSIESARAILKKGQGRVLLMDAAGRVVFDTRRKGQEIVRFTFSGSPLEAGALPDAYQEIENSSLGQLLDFVVLELKGVDLRDRSLPLAAGALTAGDAVFAAGYPMRTQGRQKEFGVPDSDGDSLRVAVGEVQAAAPADYSAFLATLMEKPQVRLFEDSILFTDLDFVSGLSGGPLLNAKGEVVSLASTVRHNREVSPADRFTVTTSYGPRFSDLAVFFR